MFTILGADGKEYGPVTADKIKEWIAGGRANLQTKARRDGESEWKTLGEFVEFTATTVPPLPGLPATPVLPVPIPVPNPTATYAPGSQLSVPSIPLADRGSRLVARIIDWLATCVVMLPGFVLMAMGGAFSENFSTLSVIGVMVFAIGWLVLIAFQFYLLATRGQTIGKRLMDVKIVTYDTSENPGFVKAVLLRAIVNGLISCVPMIGSIYTLVDIFFIFRDDRRCIHDFLANTHVVKAK